MFRLRRVPMLREFLEGWYLPLRPNVSPGHAEQLTVTITLLERWHGGPLRITQLSESLLRRFLAAYSESRAPSTVNAKRSQLLALCRLAHQEGLLRKLPMGIPRLREPRRMPDAWTADEISQLIRYARTLPGRVDGSACRTFWPSLFSTAYWTGCRATALRLTRTSDCDLSEGWILVRAETQKQAVDQLHQLPEQAVAELARHYSADRDLVWPWPYHARTFPLQVRRIMEAAGLKPSRRGMGLMQKVRRTSISYAARESLELARRLAGHSSVELTRKHYVDERIAPIPSPAHVLPALDVQPVTANSNGHCRQLELF